MKKFLLGIKNFFKKIREKKLGSINYMLIVCAVLLVFMISIMFGYGLSSKSLIVSSSKVVNETYFLVETGKFDNYNDAQTEAVNIKTIGGAGYIYYDEGFRVFLAGFTKKDDATSVINNNLDLTLSIYELKIKNIDFSNGFSQNLNQILKSNLVCFKNCVTALDEVTLKFAKGEKTNVDVKNDSLILVEEAENQLDRFMDSFYQNAKLYKLKSYYNEFVSNLKNLSTLDLSGNDFARILNYQELSCMFCLKKISDTI